MSIKTITSLIFILAQLPYNIFFKINNSYASEINNFDKVIVKENSLIKETGINKKSWYILGPGDKIFIDFPNAPFFNGTYNINPEGYINNLPELNSLYVEGLTKYDLEKDLFLKYSNFLFNPTLNISIISYRPINVFIRGEVKRPGLYNFEASTIQNSFIPKTFDISSTYKLQSLNQDIKKIRDVKIYDLLKKAGGVTNYADLSKINVIRNNPNSAGGGKVKAEINLLALLEKGDHSQNIRLFDGDSIFISRGDKMIKEQILNINKSNLSPEIMTVFITGNVVKKGPVNLIQGSSLIQAIASSGGKKLWTGKVDFIRFNSDGTTLKSSFNYDPNAPINTKKNPILMSGDIVNVRKTILGNSSQIIGEISSPIIGSYGLYKIFTD